MNQYCRCHLLRCAYIFFVTYYTSNHWDNYMLCQSDHLDNNNQKKYDLRTVVS